MKTTPTEVLERLATHCGTTPERVLALLVCDASGLCLDGSLRVALGQCLGEEPLTRTHAPTLEWAKAVLEGILRNDP